MTKILIVEDEKQISDIVIKYLQKEGYECVLASNGFEALKCFSEQAFHLLILDVMMPGIDGYEVLESIRQTSDVPVIMLTAKHQEEDRLQGFEKGADDYVSKPFSPRELVQRVKVFLKRVYPESESMIKVGDLSLDVQEMKCYKGQAEIELTSAEFKLLSVFMRHQGHVLTRDQLIELAYGTDYDGTDRNIDSYIRRLRHKIEDSPKAPQYLKTKYGLGYVFGGDV